MLKRKKTLSLKKKLSKQTTNAVYNLTIGKAINATVYKVRLCCFKSDRKRA